MNLRSFLPAARTLTLAGLALTATLSTGCLFGDDDDDDGGAGHPANLVGIWQNTTRVDGEIVEQVTAQLMANGQMARWPMWWPTSNGSSASAWTAPGAPTRTASTPP